MLKLLYTETSVHIERLSPAEWVILRQALPLTLSCFEITATVLIPASSVPALIGIPNLTLSMADAGYWEVGLKGWWWARDPESATGILIAEVTPALEALLVQACQEILT